MLFKQALRLLCVKLTSCSLKPIDIVVLKKLSDVVNVVPVIAKSDALTLEERQAFKERIREEFAFHNLRMYPYDNDEQDEEEGRASARNDKAILRCIHTLFLKVNATSPGRQSSPNDQPSPSAQTGSTRRVRQAFTS